MIEVKLKIPGGEARITAEDVPDLFKQAEQLQSLPTVCPVDDSPTILGYREAGEFEYFEVRSARHPHIRFPLGQRKESGGGGLFPKNRWIVYDHANKEEVVLWEHGALTDDGRQLRSQIMRSVEAAPKAPAPAAEEAPAPKKASTAEEKRLQAARWVAARLRDAGVPEDDWTAVVAAVVGMEKPAASMKALPLAASKEFKAMFEDVGEDVITDAWEHVKERRAPKKKGRKAEVDEFPPEPEVTF